MAVDGNRWQSMAIRQDAGFSYVMAGMLAEWTVSDDYENWHENWHDTVILGTVT